MTTLLVTTRKGLEKRLEGREGQSVMEAIRRSGLDELLAICGGCCSCATCHVYIEEAQLELLAPPGDDEDALLDASAYRQPNSRLSCQIKLGPALEGLHVTIAPDD